jgi:hypothetical protein
MTWSEEFRRPSTIIGIVVGIVGLIGGGMISLYFYLKSEKSGTISCLVEEVQVFDQTRIGETALRVVDPSGNPIKGNIFAANVTLWNSGNAEIRKEDVRKRFRILIGYGVDPIDLVPIFFSHDNQDGFQIAKDGTLEWDHFDPNEGFKVPIYLCQRLGARYQCGWYRCWRRPNSLLQTRGKTKDTF